MNNLNDLNDESLMQRIQDNDAQAFAVLVARHTRRFFGTAYRMTSHVQNAEDIVQDAFVKLWQKPEHWNPDKGAKFTTWFTHVVTNTALDFIRKQKPNIGSDIIDYIPDDKNSAVDDMIEIDRQTVVEMAIKSLPERQKQALNLCFYEEISNQDAADIMGIKIKALESLLMRAKSGVRDILVRKGLLEVKHAG